MEAKIKSIISQYFPRGINTLNTDGQIIQEILKLSNSPEKISISMIISTQNCVMKSMESKYGEEYLSTFSKHRTAATISRMDKVII